MLSRDYEEFIAALNSHRVRYLVVGAHAVAHHANPRATKDLDILFEPTRENARRLLGALRDFFGGADLGYKVEDLTAPPWGIQLGVAPTRIDLLSQIDGVGRFSEAWESRVKGRFGSEPTSYIGLDALIRAKEAAGRPQDRADVHVLRRVKERPPPAKGGRGRRAKKTRRG